VTDVSLMMDWDNRKDSDDRSSNHASADFQRFKTDVSEGSTQGHSSIRALQTVLAEGALDCIYRGSHPNIFRVVDSKGKRHVQLCS
jgi:hypothetical protein